MNIYYGNCKQETCHFGYAVADRLPNYCPECGNRLWDTAIEMIKAKERVRQVEIAGSMEKQ